MIMTVITSEKKQKIEHYFEVIEKSLYPDPREPSKILTDMGLIIFEPGSGITAVDVQGMMPQEKSILYKMDNFYDYANFINKLLCFVFFHLYLRYFIGIISILPTFV